MTTICVNGNNTQKVHFYFVRRVFFSQPKAYVWLLSEGRGHSGGNI